MMVPVQGQNGEFLSYTLADALRVCEEISLNVVAVCSDNNKVNSSGVARLCNLPDTATRADIPSHFVFNNRRVFIILDTPHNIKNWRNCWLNKVLQ